MNQKRRRKKWLKIRYLFGDKIEKWRIHAVEIKIIILYKHWQECTVHSLTKKRYLSYVRVNNRNAYPSLYRYILKASTGVCIPHPQVDFWVCHCFLQCFICIRFPFCNQVLVWHDVQMCLNLQLRDPSTLFCHLPIKCTFFQIAIYIPA